jgi:hypothetical protein
MLDKIKDWWKHLHKGEKIVVSFLLVVILLAVFSPKAEAQSPPCGPTQTVGPMLKERFGETPVFIGLDKEGNLITIYLDEEDTSWSLIRSTPDNMSCMFTAGEFGHIVTPTKGVEH